MSKQEGFPSQVFTIQGELIRQEKINRLRAWQKQRKLRKKAASEARRKARKKARKESV